MKLQNQSKKINSILKEHKMIFQILENSRTQIKTSDNITDYMKLCFI